MRLYHQLYGTIVGIGLLCVLVVGGIAVMFRDGGFEDHVTEVAELWASELPADPDLVQDRVQRLSEVLGASVALWGEQGDVLAQVGEVPAGPPGGFGGRRAHGIRIALSDGRMLGVHAQLDPRRHFRFLVLLGIIGTVVAVGCWPLARRLTRRLESLRDGAERWGEGDLDARVRVHGRDEVAQVGRAFNKAADQVQALVAAQQRVLASASHELRSPLARLRMSLELLGEGELVDGAVREVEELDSIVADVLRSARMEAQTLTDPEPVELLELLGELQADDVEVRGEPRTVQGDRRLLVRLVRNLVDNARRYGQPPIVLQTTATGFVVQDGGQALPESERQRMFEPFYRRDGHAEGVHGGVGLGLSLVRQIARFHGGEVRYVDQDGHSRFEVTLP